MSVQTKTTLKTYFETGDTPTESEFASLIDSLSHVDERKSIVVFPKHSSVSSADIGLLIMNDEGVAKVYTKTAQPAKRDGQATIEFTAVPDPPTMNGDLIVLNANPVVGDFIKIFYKTFPFVLVGGTLPNEIVIGMTAGDTLNNITTVLNNWGVADNFPIFVSNDGITLTIDWSDPDNLSQYYFKNGFDMIVPDTRFGIDFLFETQTAVTHTVQIAGNATNWNSQKWKRPLFSVFGIRVSLQNVLDETVASGTTVQSRGEFWETDLTAFADALALALDAKSADISYIRTGNSFAISNVGSSSLPTLTDWVVHDHTTDFNAAMTHSDDVVPIAAASNSIARPSLGVLIGVEGSDAIIDAGEIVKLTIGGTENVVCNSDFDFSTIDDSGLFLGNFICVPTDAGLVETLRSVNNFSSDVLDLQRKIKITSVSFYIPLSSGNVGDKILFQRCSPMAINYISNLISGT